MLDAFWFDPKGGYRTFRAGDWPVGPDRWLERCRRTGLAPGLWFGTNALVGIEPVAEWQDSLTAKKGSLSLFEGGFLAHFMVKASLYEAVAWDDRVSSQGELQRSGGATLTA